MADKSGEHKDASRKDSTAKDSAARDAQRKDGTAKDAQRKDSAAKDAQQKDSVKDAAGKANAPQAVIAETDEASRAAVEAAALGAEVISADKPKGVKRVHYTQNRELSWLKFNERVLEESFDSNVPLLERLRFISIFTSNLQEFFMIRVGSLHDLTLINKPIVDTKSFLSPQEQLDAIFKTCRPLYEKRDEAFAEVEKQLTAQGIKRHAVEDLSGTDLQFVADYAENFVLPVLSPQIIDPHHPFPHLANGVLYVMVRLKTKKGKDADLTGLIPVPPTLPRVLYLKSAQLDFLLVEDIIRSYADQIFSMYKVSEKSIICVTRNADINPDNEVFDDDQSYRYHMKKILKKRTRLAPVRLESTGKLTKAMEAFLCERLDITSQQVFSLEGPIDFSYVDSISDKCSRESHSALFYPPYSPQPSPSVDPFAPIHQQVQEHDIMLSYPYESMEPFLRLVKEASTDSEVISIKITLYRLATTSKLAEYLIAAAENGKEVTVLLELRARFDEENNIEWAERFEDAGCIVLYGFEGYKVHTKICLITRHTSDGIQQTMQLATGNYNEKTARQYCDLSIITSDPGIARDAVAFFRNMSIANLEGSYSVLWVAPVGLRQHILEHMDTEIAKARSGQGGRLIFKMNSLTDIQVINKLVEASQAGVKTDLIIRGICCIVPGIPGLTDNITVTSIVGRFLEHARVYCFGSGPDAQVYLSSADMMTRNTERRVEIAFPVNSPELRTRVLDYLGIQLADTVKARRLTRTGDYVRIPTPEGKKPICAQDYEMIQTVQSLVKLPEERPRPSIIAAMPHVRLSPSKAAEAKLTAEEEGSMRATESLENKRMAELSAARRAADALADQHAAEEARAGATPDEAVSDGFAPAYPAPAGTAPGYAAPAGTAPAYVAKIGAASEAAFQAGSLQPETSQSGAAQAIPATADTYRSEGTQAAYGMDADNGPLQAVAPQAKEPTKKPGLFARIKAWFARK